MKNLSTVAFVVAISAALSAALFVPRYAQQISIRDYHVMVASVEHNIQAAVAIQEPSSFQVSLPRTSPGADTGKDAIDQMGELLPAAHSGEANVRFSLYDVVNLCRDRYRAYFRRGMTTRTSHEALVRAELRPPIDSRCAIGDFGADLIKDAVGATHFVADEDRAWEIDWHPGCQGF